MDLKRNYSSNIQPPTQIKANHLVNPIAAITNASTPVRTRVIKPSSQLNSTPVNVHKIGVPAKTPTILNKQNDSGNCKFGLKKPKVTEQNINLSPIMALNRKMSEGPQLQYRSFTPTGFKRQQSMSNMLQRKQLGKNEQLFTQNLQDSRSEGSFRTMLQSRSKTPTRIAFAQICQKQSSPYKSNISSNGNYLGMNGLRTSGSAQSLLQGIGIGLNNNSNGQFNINNASNKLKESRNKLLESRSFQQLINIGTPVVRDDEVLCSNSNQHQKKVKAKYKVIEQPQDEQLLVYCSKCAINLVQKGFKVQDLTQYDLQKIRNQKRSNPYNTYNTSHSEYHDYATQTSHKLQIKLNELKQQKDNLIIAYQKQLDDVDCYYNSIISMIQHKKSKDRQTLLRCKDRQRTTGDTLEKKLTEAVGQLGYMIKSGRVGSQQLPYIQDYQSLLTEKGFGCRFDGSKCLVDNIQQKFNNFSEIFQSEGKLKLEQFDRSDRPVNPVNYYSNPIETKERSDCALRFSFEKNMRQTRKSPLGYRNQQMNALEEAPQALQGEDSRQYSNEYDGNNKEKKAFRTLFPEQEQEDCQRQQGIHSPTFKQI